MSERVSTPRGDNGERALATTLVRVACLMLIAAMGINLVQALLAPARAFILMLTVLWMGGAILVAWALVDRGRPRQAGAALIIVVYAMLLYVAASSDGVYSASYVSLIGVAILGVWLVGLPWTIALVGVSALAGIGLLWAERTGLIAKPHTYETPVEFWASQIILTLLLVTLQSALLRQVRQTNAERLRSEAHYRALLNQAADAIFSADVATGRLLDANVRACELVGRSLAELRTMHQSQLHPPEEEAAVRAAFSAHVANPSQVIRQQVIHADGRRIPVEVATSLVSNPDGSLAMLGIFRDISERLRVEQELLRGEERARATFDQAAVGMCRASLDGRLLQVNSRFCALTGYDHDVLLKLTFRHLTHPDDLAADIALGRKLEAGELDTYTLEQRYIRQDSITIWVNLTMAPIRGPTGAIEELLAVVEDITARKLAEWSLRQLNATLEERVTERTLALKSANDRLHAEIAVRRQVELALRESETRYRELLESLKQGVVVIQDERIAFCNKAAAELLGHSVEYLLSGTLRDLLMILHPDDRQRVASGLQEAFSEGVPVRDEPLRVNINGHGAVRWLNTATRNFNFEGRPALITVFSDITRLKYTEEQLRQSEARLQMLLATTPAVIFTANAWDDFTITFISESVRSLLGYDPGRFTDQRSFWQAHVHSDDLAGFRSDLTLLYERGWHLHEYRFLHVDGSYHWLEAGMTLLQGAERREVVGYLIDSTRRKAAEEALRQSRDELREVNSELARAARLKDEFLANMSHELRTPLNAILGRAELLAEEIHGPLNPRQQRSIASIEESGRHLLELINDILDLSKIEADKLDLQVEPVSVADLCASSLRLVTEAATKKGIKLAIDGDPRADRIQGDPRRLKQLLVNLLSNAVKFTPPGGSVGLEVRGDSEAGQVVITVWDTGIGIAESDLPRLFRPFEQLDSKLSRQYEGTGLGLSLVARLARLHGGSVAVESAPGEGSRFSVTLPWQA